MTIEAKTTVYSAPFPASFRSNDGTCAKEWAVVRSSGSVTTRKIARESRVKPNDLLRNLTARETQSVVRTKNLVYQRKVTGSVVCGGVSKVGVTTTYETTGVRSATLIYPTADWAQALRLKLLNLQYSWAETIGEWRESVTMLEGGANVVKRAFSEARKVFKSRRKWKSVIRAMKKLVPDTSPGRTKKSWEDVFACHLAITYGITPIISTIEDALSQDIMSRAMRVQVTIKTEAHASVVDSLGPYEATGAKSLRAVAYVWLRPDTGNYTSGNLAESIWAGTGLSFVVDWFINVGAYLQSLNSLDFIQEVRGTLTTLEEKEYKDYGQHVNGLIEPGIVRSRSIGRSLFSSIPMPKRVNYSFPSGEGLVNQLTSLIEIFSLMRSKR